jgi:peptide/nickel transport system substrate-binding protein
MTRFFSVTNITAVIETAKTSDRWFLRILLTVVAVSFVWVLLAVNQVVSVPGVSAGGELTEGILGTPRFLNPVLALTRADQDVTALVYSGLMKISPEGRLVPDIAESVVVSNDGTTYTINLRNDVFFHDGVQLTANDVLFTIELAQNADLKSPLRGNWDEVIVEVVDDQSLLVSLLEPYAPFIENFSLGILPAHIWRTIPIEQVPFSEFNTTPVGSGPYRVDDAEFSRSGTVDSYNLKAVEGHYQSPLIETITLQFFATETAIIEALQTGDIDATTYIPSEHLGQIDTTRFNVISAPLPRTFGLFFNQNRSVALRDASVREALEVVLDRQAIVDKALSGSGIPSLPSTLTSTTTVESGEVSLGETEVKEQRFTNARSILKDADWTLTDIGTWEKEIDDSAVPLTVTIRTANNPTLEATLEAVADSWRELGVTVLTEQYEQTDLVQSVIRPRDFGVLLFGLDTSRSRDLFPFWHSSQQNDPGLNITQYANLTVDGFLETARVSQNEIERDEAINGALAVIMEERPAIFLFQPANVYVIGPGIRTAPMKQIGRPSDRFSNIAVWNTDTRALWPFFREEVETAQ